MRCRRRDKNCKNNRGFVGKAGVTHERGVGGGNCAGFYFVLCTFRRFSVLLASDMTWAAADVLRPLRASGREPTGLSVSLNPLGEFDVAWDGGTQGRFRSVHYWPEEVHALLDH